MQMVRSGRERGGQEEEKEEEVICPPADKSTQKIRNLL